MIPFNLCRLHGRLRRGATWKWFQTAWTTLTRSTIYDTMILFAQINRALKYRTAFCSVCPPCNDKDHSPPPPFAHLLQRRKITNSIKSDTSNASWNFVQDINCPRHSMNWDSSLCRTWRTFWTPTIFSTLRWAVDIHNNDAIVKGTANPRVERFHKYNCVVLVKLS